MSGKVTVVIVLLATVLAILLTLNWSPTINPPTSHALSHNTINTTDFTRPGFPPLAVVTSKRRPFDLETAKAEGYLESEHGGLNAEDRRLLAHLYGKVNSVLEWGIGESTTIAAFTRLPRYTGVDSSLEWLGSVRQKAPAHYRFVWADIGIARGSFGRPTTMDSASKFPFYSVGALAQEPEAFDFYFVDGRFRLSCAAAAFLHASAHGKSRDEFVVAIHDFRWRYLSGRPTAADGSSIAGPGAVKNPKPYADILDVADAIDGFLPDSPSASQAHMTVLRRKPNVTDAQIRAIWNHAKLDWE